jgi:hypothetical protein
MWLVFLMMSYFLKVLFERKGLTQYIICSDMPKYFILYSSLLWNITTKRNPIHFYYNMYGHILESIQHAKYLDVTISTDRKWNTHIQQTAVKANKSLCFIRRFYSSFEVFLELESIVVWFDLSIDHTVICKKSDTAMFDVFREVVNVD